MAAKDQGKDLTPCISEPYFFDFSRGGQSAYQHLQLFLACIQDATFWRKVIVHLLQLPLLDFINP